MPRDANGKAAPRDRGAVYIHARELYDQMQRTERTLIRVEAQLSSLVTKMDSQKAAYERQVEALHRRISAMEPKVWALPSGAAFVGLVGIIIGLLRGGTL